MSDIETRVSALETKFIVVADSIQQSNKLLTEMVENVRNDVHHLSEKIYTDYATQGTTDDLQIEINELRESINDLSNNIFDLERKIQD